MWHDIVPRLAYQHGFLMHALLACNTLHMAYLNPNKHSKLTIQAKVHQDHAIPLSRAAIQSVESETCDSILMFARLVAITAFAWTSAS